MSIDVYVNTFKPFDTFDVKNFYSHVSIFDNSYDTTSDFEFHMVYDGETSAEGITENAFATALAIVSGWRFDALLNEINSFYDLFKQYHNRAQQIVDLGDSADVMDLINYADLARACEKARQSANHIYEDLCHMHGNAYMNCAFAVYEAFMNRYEDDLVDAYEHMGWL